MRISTEFKYDSSSAAIDNAASLQQLYQQQLVTGKKLNQPSDNPYGAFQALTMTALKNTLNQYNSNLVYGKQILGESDNALNSINSLTGQAYQIAVQAANTTTSQDGFNGMVNQITTIQSEILSLANTQGSNGEYIFAGQKTQAAPFTVAGGVMTYGGDNASLTIAVGPNQTMDVNTQAGSMLTGLYASLEQLKTDLSSGNISSISNNDIAALQSAQSSVLQARGVIGGNLNQVTNLTSNNSQRINDLTSQISGFTDADIAQVATQYQAAANTYQAALTMAGKIQQLSLANYIA